MELRFASLRRLLACFLLIHSNENYKVDACIDMLLKEFSQMFAGPGGTLMGTSNANNLDRIRIFNNYQGPSVDQIEDEQSMEGKMDDEYDDTGDELVSRTDVFGVNERGGRKSQTGDSVKHAGQRSQNIDMGKIGTAAQRRNMNGRQESTRRHKSSFGGKSANERTMSKTIEGSKPGRLRNQIRADETRSVHGRKLGPPSQSLYNLEPKSPSYRTAAYKPNAYVDTDEDSMSFQTRDDTRNRVKTRKVNQPLIEMMTNVLDTMQLTSKHDYKRAKEREAKEEARRELKRLYPD